MSASTRLDRVMPKLSFDERLDGVIAAYREDRCADPGLFETMAESDYGRWNRVARILNAVHRDLGWYIDMLDAHVQQEELRLAVAQQSQLAGMLLRGRGAEMEEAVDGLCQRVIAGVVQRWQEARLAEVAIEQFREELGGRQPLHPEVAATLQRCKERLLALCDELGRADLPLSYEFDLPEPRASDCALMVDVLTRQRTLP